MKPHWEYLPVASTVKLAGKWQRTSEPKHPFTPRSTQGEDCLPMVERLNQESPEWNGISCSIANLSIQTIMTPWQDLLQATPHESKQALRWQRRHYRSWIMPFPWIAVLKKRVIMRTFELLLITDGSKKMKNYESGSHGWDKSLYSQPDRQCSEPSRKTQIWHSSTLRGKEKQSSVQTSPLHFHLLNR